MLQQFGVFKEDLVRRFVHQVQYCTKYMPAVSGQGDHYAVIMALRGTNRDLSNLDS